MTDPIIVVAGFSSTNKVPGYFGSNIFVGGKPAGNLFQRRVLLVGRMGSNSTAAVATIYPIYSEGDSMQFGYRGELARMIRAAVRANPSATIFACAVADTGSPAAATATITIAGTSTAAYTFAYRFAGVLVTGTVPAGSTVTQAAAVIRDAFNANPELPMAATSSAGVVTITVDTLGARGNQYILAQDATGLASGVTSNLAGGSALASGAVPLSGGSVGTESYTSLLAAVATAQYDRIAPASNDATSLQAWQAHLLSQSGALVGNLEQLVYATNTTLSAAQSLTQSSLNEPLMQALWLLNSETHPSELAAIHAATRATTEEANPSPRYLNTPVPGAAPQVYRGDWPGITVLDAALQSGVTPLRTTEDGKVVVVRGICTYSKNGSSSDFRCLDINVPTMGQYARQRGGQIWNDEILPVYIHVRPNPGPDDPDPPGDVIYPDLWKRFVMSEHADWEGNGWAIETAENPPTVVYDKTGKRLMMEEPVVATPLNYQLGVNVRSIQP